MSESTGVNNAGILALVGCFVFRLSLVMIHWVRQKKPRSSSRLNRLPRGLGGLIRSLH